MAKILKFPSKGELRVRELEKTVEEVAAHSDECVETSQFLMEVLEEFITSGQASELSHFMNMNFRDERYQESRDMFVIVNMINAMLNRQVGIPHALHRTLDKSYIQIKRLIQVKQDQDFELIFPNPEDFDDSD